MTYLHCTSVYFKKRQNRALHQKKIMDTRLVRLFQFSDLSSSFLGHQLIHFCCCSLQFNACYFLFPTGFERVEGIYVCSRITGENTTETNEEPSGMYIHCQSTRMPLYSVLMNRSVAYLRVVLLSNDIVLYLCLHILYYAILYYTYIHTIIYQTTIHKKM